MLKNIKETFLHDTKKRRNINYLILKKYFQIPLKMIPLGHIFLNHSKDLREISDRIEIHDFSLNANI